MITRRNYVLKRREGVSDPQGSHIWYSKGFFDRGLKTLTSLFVLILCIKVYINKILLIFFFKNL